jgi:hypothetical protein
MSFFQSVFVFVFCRSLGFWRRVYLQVDTRRFGEICCQHFQGLKWQGREVEGLYRTWRARDEGREPIRGKEYGNWMRTNREPSGRLQRGGGTSSGKMKISCNVFVLFFRQRFHCRNKKSFCKERCNKTPNFLTTVLILCESSKDLCHSWPSPADTWHICLHLNTPTFLRGFALATLYRMT